MSYRRNSYDLGECIEREEFHNGRYGAPGEKRQPKKKPTKEQIEKQNRKNRTKKIRRLLRKNFKEGDYWSTLTFRPKERPPDLESTKKILQKFLQRMRDAYKRRGEELKYVVKIEIGAKGGIHCHVIANRIPDTDVLIQRYWTYGGIHNELLYQDGNFSRLAEYVGKWPGDTDEKTGKVTTMKEAWYSRSRNLIEVQPEKEILSGKTFGREPRAPKGYYLDKESLVEGINPVTGYRYRSYTLVRITPAAEKRRRI
jgi:hypothetical protein